ncbi:MAG: hypothetical protein IPG98_13850 [Burkholderiales bacterium]|nr:hypothetical protein [Burkholderiales bacterium]
MVAPFPASLAAARGNGALHALALDRGVVRSNETRRLDLEADRHRVLAQVGHAGRSRVTRRGE